VEGHVDARIRTYQDEKVTESVPNNYCSEAVWSVLRNYVCQIQGSLIKNIRAKEAAWPTSEAGTRSDAVTFRFLHNNKYPCFTPLTR